MRSFFVLSILLSSVCTVFAAPMPMVAGDHYHTHGNEPHGQHTDCGGHQGPDGPEYICHDKRLGPVDLHMTGYWKQLFTDYSNPQHRFGGLSPKDYLAKWATPQGWNYPKNDGFHDDARHGKGSLVEIHPSSYGGQLDRFGWAGGAYLAPVGTHWEQRAMPPSSLNTPAHQPRFNYHRYQIVKPFKARVGKIAPAFGMVGGGEQIKLVGIKVKDLIEQGILKEIQFNERTPSPTGSQKSLGSHKSLSSNDENRKPGA